MKQPCIGSSAVGPCHTKPRYSIATDPGQTDDQRVCTRHLLWLVAKLTADGPVVVARLIRGSTT